MWAYFLRPHCSLYVYIMQYNVEYFSIISSYAEVGEEDYVRKENEECLKH